MKKAVLWALAAAAALAAVMCAPAPMWARQAFYGPAAPPITHVAYAATVRGEIDSLAATARTTRTESAVCLAGYAVSNDTLTLATLTVGEYDRADSVAIYSHTPICPHGVPSLHTHVAYAGFPRPSATDVETERATGMWAAILSVTDSGWRVIVY